MRVLHVIDSLAGSGGAEQGLVREVSRFSTDVQQRVVTLYDRMELAGQLREQGDSRRTDRLEGGLRVSKLAQSGRCTATDRP